LIGPLEMGTARIEAFSDSVMAVFRLHTEHASDPALWMIWPSGNVIGEVPTRIETPVEPS